MPGTSAIAGLALVLGFTAAQLTGLRWLGGVIVVAGAAWCVLRERKRTPLWRLAAVVVIGAVCFVLAHVLADGLGPWFAVALAAAVLAGASWWLTRPRPPAGSPTVSSPNATNS